MNQHFSNAETLRSIAGPIKVEVNSQAEQEAAAAAGAYMIIRLDLIPNISRTSTGKLLFDDFSDSTVEPWSIVSGNITIDTGRLSLLNSPDCVVSQALASNFRPLAVQAKIQTTLGTGQILTLELRKDANNYFYFAVVTGTSKLSRVLSGVNSDIVTWASGTAYYETARTVVFSIESDNTYRGWVDNTLRLSTTNTDLTGSLAQPRMSSSNSAGKGLKLDDYVLMQGVKITCTNLPAGYKFRVGGSGGVTATNSSGVSATVTADCGTLTFPQSFAEVLDSSDRTLAIINLPNDIWGGDVFSCS